MDVREKLIELIAKAKYICANDYSDHTEDEYIADTLLDNGVTVQEWKPLEAFLHPVDAYKGLKAKYLVFKSDTGERVGNCFVLRPVKYPAAVEAIRAYASATDNETLAEDIYNWVGKGEPVQECGEWVHPKGYVVSNGFLCSKCGHKEASYYPINPRPGGSYIADENGNFFYPPKLNYCPNCGAKMDLEG